MQVSSIRFPCRLPFYLFVILSILSILPISSYAQIMVPPGDFVLFEDHRLYYYCQGSGSPSVLIDGGIGDSSANWLPIQDALSKQLQVCIYDRGGYGMSDPGPGERTTKQIVRELYRLLKIAEIPGPYIIVGQSFGGFTAQYFAKKFPNETAGLVLVDSSHPLQVQHLEDLDLYSREERTLVTGRDENKTGDIGVWQKQWHMLNSRRKAVFAQMDELKYFEQSAAEVEAAGTMPDIPLLVLTRDKRLLPTMDNGHSMEDVWRDMQTDLANSSEKGSQRIVEDSGHNIHIDAPQAIIDAVLEIYRASNNID